ncbi:MAG: glycosyltransferase family 4 protein [Candidatus Omnitrophica bacterium]|nr:glycosyltransferase family 4 protein [Candidatus Omnitrophota bacterium]
MKKIIDVGKNIFLISPHPVYPVLDGASRRIDGFCRYLSLQNHRITLFSPSSVSHFAKNTGFAANIEYVNFEAKYKINYFFNPSLARLLKNRIASKPDWIILNFPYLAKTVLSIAQRYSVPVHLDEHNIESLRFKEMGRPLVSLFVDFFESYAIRKSKSISVTSVLDYEYIKKRFSCEPVLIENFIDTDKFFPVNSEKKRELKNKFGVDAGKIVLYFGNFTNISTQEAYKIICQQISSDLFDINPQIKILIAGRGVKSCKNPSKNIIMVGELEKIEELIQIADLVIVPIVSGGGTRFKILEALGCGVQVLSTPKGAEGLNIGDDEGLRISSIQDFPKKISDFLNTVSDDSRREFISSKVNSKYGFDNVFKKLDFL